MQIAEGAMREGLLYDMLGRYKREDARERTVRAMQQRYHVDTEQAERVEATVRDFLEQARDTWKLEEPLAHLALKWAARLHEIGLDVSHSGYHRHGAYLLENADMPGFPREEQRLLARLVGAHRRKLTLDRIEELVPPWDTARCTSSCCCAWRCCCTAAAAPRRCRRSSSPPRRSRWSCASRRAG